jgi:hypothetical protein
MTGMYEAQMLAEARAGIEVHGSVGAFLPHARDRALRLDVGALRGRASRGFR